MRAMQNQTSITYDWRDYPVAILAGGPSLTRDQVDAVHSAHKRGWKVIAVNNSYLIAPWAALLYFCDKRWYSWHAAQYGFTYWRGAKLCLEHAMVGVPDRERVPYVLDDGFSGLSTHPDRIRTGANSAYQALNVAYLAGAKKIALFGVDMAHVDGKSHWHAGHPVKSDGGEYAVMLSHWPTSAAPLAAAGVKVWNCSPVSKIECFSKAHYADVLRS